MKERKRVGLELYATLYGQYNSIKMAAMSGYPLGRVHLPEGVGWLEKPPSLERLSQVVRKALDD